MKLRSLILTAGTTALVSTVLYQRWRYNLLMVEYAKLVDEIVVTEKDVEAVMGSEALESLREYRGTATASVPRAGYRIPNDEEPRTARMDIGNIAFVPARGYFGGIAYFVVFPAGFDFADHEAALGRTYQRITRGQFVLERCPGTSMGGSDAFDAIIKAAKPGPEADAPNIEDTVEAVYQTLRELQLV